MAMSWGNGGMLAGRDSRERISAYLHPWEVFQKLLRVHQTTPRNASAMVTCAESWKPPDFSESLTFYGDVDIS